MRIDPAEFRALPLEVHRLLADVPLRDVSAVDLPGGGPDRTIADVRALLADGPSGAANPLVRALFGLRRLLGRLLGWDAARFDDDAFSYRGRLPPALVERSLVAPGTDDGAFRALYLLEQEYLVEIRNATVQAFLASVLRQHGDGYRLYWAVYVKPVSCLTTFYMALIEPFRRFLVYPSILAGIRRRWRARYHDDRRMMPA